jgi:hypothetical protein
MLHPMCRLIIACLLLLSLCACASAAPPRLLGPPIKAGDTLDYSCHSDADCVVKDVGNCCGRFDACVNRDSPTFPEQVRAECAKKGMAGVCGFPVIEGCACVEGHCSTADPSGGATR